MPELRIVGTGGFAREVLQWVRDAGLLESYTFAGFVGPEPVLGHPTIADDDLEIASADRLVLGIGQSELRRRVTEALQARGARFLSVIHPTALISPTATIGEGVVICPHASVTDAATLGPFALLNLYALAAHDSRVADFAVLSPRATLGGHATLEADAFLGAHASVAPGCTVGQNSRVTAGTAVLRDAPAGSLVMGVPGVARAVYAPAVESAAPAPLP